MKKKKKVLTFLLVCLMLLGLMICVQAAEPAEPHVHAYSRMQRLISSGPYASHQYVTGTYTDGNGNVVKQYGTCSVGLYRYLEYNQCACGAEDHSNDRTIEKLYHPSCGKGWENH